MAGSSHSAESNIDNSLQRGRACAYCRRRKMRCDGVRPVCGQCSRTSRADDCEYTDSQSRSRAEILEEDISRIESRIYELEHPEKAAEGSVLLHHPYHLPQNLAQLSVGSGPPRPAQSTANNWWNGPEPPGTFQDWMTRSSHSAESNSENRLQRGRACAYCRRRKMRCDGVRPVCGQCSRTSRANECKYTDSQSRSREEEDISQIESRIYELEHPEKAAEGSVLLHHSYHPPQNPPNLFQLSDSSVGSGPRPAQSTADTWGNGPEFPMDLVETLLDAFLPYAHDWGFFLDISDFRRDALSRLPMGHHSRPSPPLLTGVYLIGITLSHSPTMKTHEKAFLSRTLSALPVSLSGIHPRKVTHALQTEILLSSYFYAHGRLLEGRYHTAAAVSLMVSSVLPKINREQLPFQSLTEGEIDGFWTTIILDKSWAVVLATQPNLQHQCDEMFNTNSSLIDDTETSTDVPLLATATMLWERANSLMAGWDAGMTPQESYNFYSAFNTLDTRIQHFNATISHRGGSQDVPDDRQLLVGRSIAHAVIQLHETFCQTNPESKQRCSAAAKSILNLLASGGLHNFAFINPVISTIWVTASEIVVDEIASLRTVRLAWAHEVPTSAETSLVSLLNRGVEVMRRFASWPLIRFQLAKIEQAYSSL